MYSESAFCHMPEKIFNQVDNLTYWQDRNVKAVEYQQAGIYRVDFVHVTLVPWPAHDQRYLLIIQRANDLLKAGIPVIEANLYDQLDGIHGANIVVGGAIENECVLTRAKFLKQQGAGQVIIDLALAANH